MPAIERAETKLCASSETLSVSLHQSKGAMTPLVSRAVGRARVGDLDAIRFLYARYADNVYGYARTIVDDHDDARDITQRIFAGLTHLIESYEEREIPFQVWIRRIARSLAVDCI